MRTQEPANPNIANSKSERLKIANDTNIARPFTNTALAAHCTGSTDKEIPSNVRGRHSRVSTYLWTWEVTNIRVYLGATEKQYRGSHIL